MIPEIKHPCLLSTTLLLICIFLAGCSEKDNPWQLYSPDRQILVEITLEERTSQGKLFYSVFMLRNGTYRPVMDPSPLGIVREDTRFAENLEFVSATQRQEVSDRYTLTSGKQLECSTIHNALALVFKNHESRQVEIAFRAYNGGIAFRYGFSGHTGPHVRVTGEFSGFDFMKGSFWGHPYDTVSRWSPAYETYFEGPLEVGTPAPSNKNGWAFPFLIESEGTWFLVSEAGFDGGFGASHLESGCSGGLYTIRFAEQQEAEGYYDNTSHGSPPWHTPWRFIAIGSNPGEIVATSLPTDLSAPSRIEDASWIRPGRASWSWWSDSDSPQDYNKLVPFVDFAARMGWEYSLVDANWNRMKNGDLEKLARYAESKGIGLLLWYNSGGKHNTVTEEPRDLMDDREARRKEFERIRSLGIRGVKVDFFQSDKQAIIRQYVELFEDAADHRLVVNCHGCTMPKGWRRTWPNLLTMEAVRGGECYKFDGQFPEKAPAHLTIVPFTRNAVGPVDYTPGGFSDHTYPHLTTYGFEMALTVLLESGIMHYMDTPEKTSSLPPFAVRFLQEIPVTWDKTVLIAGYPGKEAVIARTKDGKWFIGGINGEGISKELILDLGLTGEAPRTIHLIVDGRSDDTLTEKVVETDRGRFTVAMEPYGGFTGSW